MLLYKFKSAQDVLYALDIAMHEQLFCSDYAALNDPFEGQFRTASGGTNLGFTPLTKEGRPSASKIIFSNLASHPLSGPTRVCSLSDRWRDVRMWALYADSFRGMAFEFDVDPNDPQVHQVAYSREFPKIPTGLLSSPETIDALTRKTRHWKYESEWRFISAETYISLPGRLTRILLGSRISPTVRDALLKVACAHTRIFMVGLDPAGVRMTLEQELLRVPQ
ncbi:DUF2971 domain-containing protein [Stenotrophomonas nematodicola]|uniref:DUF2971 domain-containing protein n=1 Tax=Stenotrophomonas nematodicola TaxID=2656746 RepID=A0ABW7CY08_9GAMM